MHLVTVLEEMPVQETVDGIADLREARLPGRRRRGQHGASARPRRAPTSTAARPARSTARRSRPTWPRRHRGADGLVDSLLEEARDHAERRALEDSQRTVVEALDVPSYELPRLPGGIDLGGLYELAAGLREQGLA